MLYQIRVDIKNNINIPFSKQLFKFFKRSTSENNDHLKYSNPI